MRKNQQRVRELEVISLAGMDEKNADALKNLVDGYREMIFPGFDKDDKKDEWVERAKVAIAKEAQKVYIVKSGTQAAKSSVRQAAASSNPEMRKWAQHEMHKEKMGQERLKQRLKRGGRALPPGVFHQGVAERSQKE